MRKHGNPPGSNAGRLKNNQDKQIGAVVLNGEKPQLQRPPGVTARRASDS